MFLTRFQRTVAGSGHRNHAPSSLCQVRATTVAARPPLISPSASPTDLIHCFLSCPPSPSIPGLWTLCGPGTARHTRLSGPLPETRSFQISPWVSPHLLQVCTQVSPEDDAFPGHLFKVSLTHTHTHTPPPSFPILFFSAVPITENILYVCLLIICIIAPPTRMSAAWGRASISFVRCCIQAPRHHLTQGRTGRCRRVCSWAHEALQKRRKCFAVVWFH